MPAAIDYQALLEQTAAVLGSDVKPEDVPSLVANLKAAYRQRIVDTAFAAYQSLWMKPGTDHILEQAIRELGEWGYGAMHGFLIPDGSYLDEETGQIDGKIGPFDRVWRRDTGWLRANAGGVVEWPA